MDFCIDNHDFKALEFFSKMHMRAMRFVSLLFVTLLFAFNGHATGSSTNPIPAANNFMIVTIDTSVNLSIKTTSPLNYKLHTDTSHLALYFTIIDAKIGVYNREAIINKQPVKSIQAVYDGSTGNTNILVKLSAPAEYNLISNEAGFLRVEIFALDYDGIKSGITDNKTSVGWYERLSAPYLGWPIGVFILLALHIWQAGRISRLNRQEQRHATRYDKLHKALDTLMGHIKIIKEKIYEFDNSSAIGRPAPEKLKKECLEENQKLIYFVERSEHEIPKEIYDESCKIYENVRKYFEQKQSSNTADASVTFGKTEVCINDCTCLVRKELS